MSYVLQALIARAEVLGAHLDVDPWAKLIRLQQGFGLVPLTPALFDSLQARSMVQEIAHPAGFYFLSAAVVDWAERISRDGLVAYVEAEFAGGSGTQAAIVWRDQTVVLGPLVTTNEPGMPGEWKGPSELRDWAINRALRLLGVEMGEAIDEFAALGLPKHRHTEDWAKL